MRIKSTVWQWMAAGSFGAGLLYAMGIEGGAQVGGTITDGQFVAAMGLILLAVLLMQISFRAEEREEKAKRKRSGRPSQLRNRPDGRVACSSPEGGAKNRGRKAG